MSVCIKLFLYTEVLQYWKQRSTTITLTKWRHKDEPRDFSLPVSSSQFTRLTSTKISLNVKKVEANGLTWPFNVTFFSRCLQIPSCRRLVHPTPTRSSFHRLPDPTVSLVLPKPFVCQSLDNSDFLLVEQYWMIHKLFMTLRAPLRRS